MHQAGQSVPEITGGGGMRAARVLVGMLVIVGLADLCAASICALGVDYEY